MKRSMFVFCLLWMIGLINFVVIANNYVITTELTYLTKAETVYITNEVSVYNNNILIHDRFKGVVQISESVQIKQMAIRQLHIIIKLENMW